MNDSLSEGDFLEHGFVLNIFSTIRSSKVNAEDVFDTLEM